MSCPSHCKDCKRPLRTKHMSKELHPDALVHAGFGQCGTCRIKTRESEGAPIKASVSGSGLPRPTLAQLLAERDQFRAARRARGVPDEGVIYGRYADA